MQHFIGTLLFFLFLFLSLIHFYWGMGGKWGSKAALPTTSNNELLFQPGLIACFIVGLGLLSFGLLALNESTIISITLPLWLSTYGLYILAGIFALRSIGDFKYVGLSRKVNDTLFAEMDRKFYTPLCLTITVLILLLKLGG